MMTPDTLTQVARDRTRARVAEASRRRLVRRDRSVLHTVATRPTRAADTLAAAPGCGPC